MTHMYNITISLSEQTIMNYKRPQFHQPVRYIIVQTYWKEIGNLHATWHTPLLRNQQRRETRRLTGSLLSAYAVVHQYSWDLPLPIY